MSKEIEIRHFGALLEAGELPLSSLPSSVRQGQALENLVSAGVLALRKKGAGKVVSVIDSNSFERYLDQRFPGRKEISGGSAIGNQRRYRDSKGGTRTGLGLVLLRGWQTINIKGIAVNLEEATTNFGGFACFQPHLEVDKLCTVENLEVFTNVEAVLGKDYVYAHTYGRLGPKSFPRLAAKEILHFGDWDYTGLDEYLRLKSYYLHTRLHVPANLASLWSSYSKPLKKGAVITQRLRNCQEQQVVEVLQLLG